jgi:hypothetical protein
MSHNLFNEATSKASDEANVTDWVLAEQALHERDNAPTELSCQSNKRI